MKWKRRGYGTADEKLCELEYASYRRDARVEFCMNDHFDADMGLTPLPESGRYKEKLMKHVLAEIKRVSLEHPQVPIVILIQPSKRDLARGESMPGMVEIMKQGASEAKLDTIDLTPHFAPAGISFFNSYDNHWNSPGRQVAAELTARKLIQMFDLQAQA
jgi:hypothetical protein